MDGFRNVVVAMDFSHSATHVLDTALRVLAPGGRMLLVHAVEWVPSVVEGTFVGYTNPMAMGSMRDESAALLKKQAEAHPGVKIDVAVVEGKIANVLLEVAEREHADLVVLGSHALGPLAHLLVGSQAEKVLRRAHCPILCVPVPA
jgi:nucleotide-binding universal stress UspA family protein